MRENSEEPCILLFLWKSPAATDVRGMWETEMHDEDRGLRHQAPRQLHHGVTGGQCALRRRKVRGDL